MHRRKSQETYQKKSIAPVQQASFFGVCGWDGGVELCYVSIASLICNRITTTPDLHNIKRLSVS
jgi:hypothetical protein